MFVPILFTCCFHCSVKAVKSSIADLLLDLPPGAWVACRERILLPILRQIASLAAMPARWADPGFELPCCPPPPERPSNRTRALIKIRYWEMCRLVRVVRPSGELFGHFHTLADYIVGLLDAQNTAALWLQINLANNRDVVLRTVAHVAASKRPRQMPDVVADLAACGALHYAHMLATHIEGRNRATTDDFARQIQHEIENQERMRLMLALSSKDPNSSLHALSGDMLRAVVALTHTEPVLLEDVLREYVEHDIYVRV